MTFGCKKYSEYSCSLRKYMICKEKTKTKQKINFRIKEKEMSNCDNKFRKLTRNIKYFVSISSFTSVLRLTVH